mgnify:FL=1
MEGIEIFATSIPDNSTFAVGGQNNKAGIATWGDREAAAIFTDVLASHSDL